MIGSVLWPAETIALSHVHVSCLKNLISVSLLLSAALCDRHWPAVENINFPWPISPLERK